MARRLEKLKMRESNNINQQVNTVKQILEVVQQPQALKNSGQYGHAAQANPFSTQRLP